jgi:L-fuconolactonase
MGADLNRRECIGALAALPFAVEAALAAQTTAPIPIIDSHIHLFDKSRPEGSPYPSETSLLGQNFQSALPARYRAVAGPFGVVGAIVIEAQVGSPRIEDNQWVLDIAARDPVIVGTVGRLDPGSSDFGRNLERFRKDRLFLGIRQSQLAPALEKPEFATRSGTSSAKTACSSAATGRRARTSSSTPTQMSWPWRGRT